MYGGSQTLPSLVEEILSLTPAGSATTAGGHPFAVTEIVLVWDVGPDESDAVMRDLESSTPEVRCVWLSRNYGQHAATMAGMASTTADWVVTLDEDGQHDPADIPRLLDAALASHAQVVYGVATNDAPHSWLRRTSSGLAKWIARRLLSEDGLGDYSSYRLVLGEVARAVAAYGGHGVFLDVALSWVTGPSAGCPVQLRDVGRPSGYSLRRLLGHFGRLVVSSGVRPLRFVSVLGLLSALGGFALATYLLWQRVIVGAVVEGWTSVMVAILVVGGLVLLGIGVLAEYLAVAVKLAVGRPPYLVVSDPARGPLGPRRDSRSASS